MEEPDKVNPVKAEEPGIQGTKGTNVQNMCKSHGARSTGAREPRSLGAIEQRYKGAKVSLNQGDFEPRSYGIEELRCQGVKKPHIEYQGMSLEVL